MYLEEIQGYKIYFRHALNYDIVFPGELKYQNGTTFVVTWKPLVKGFYNAYINDTKIPTKHRIYEIFAIINGKKMKRVDLELNKEEFEKDSMLHAHETKNNVCIHSF